ncbi:MAG: epoxyqueuosine reductase QueH [Ruminococcaceae bacterium]|nr:epoxyqueuosine reductase QueH [Oscillospiraceae bacterium]
MKRNYQKELETILASLNGERKRLLLHSCCGPCSSYCLEYLTQYFDVTVFFYNPCILPAEEFEKRLYWQRHLLEAAPFCAGVELIVPERDEAAFWAAADGLEQEREGGARCTECFALRLGKTRDYAEKGGFDYFATTLTVSPHKNAELINRIGFALAEGHPCLWLPSDFKKRDGYRRSIALSHEYGLYRQSWCGCGLGGEETDQNGRVL